MNHNQVLNVNAMRKDATVNKEMATSARTASVKTDNRSIAVFTRSKKGPPTKHVLMFRMLDLGTSVGRCCSNLNLGHPSLQFVRFRLNAAKFLLHSVDTRVH